MHRYMTRIGHIFTVHPTNAEAMSLEDALRSGVVQLVRDRNRQLLDGSRADMCYVRLCKAPIGSFEIEYIPHYDAERIAADVGVTIEEITAAS